MIFLLALAFLGGPPDADGLITVPGVVNMAITDANKGQTICNPHWSTKSIRPPTSYTNKIKFALMDKAGIPRSQSKLYELDHDISIELAGHPSDPNNLSLQPYFGRFNAHLKDKLENRLHKETCNGTISLTDAQSEISSNWIAAYEKRFGPIP